MHLEIVVARWLPLASLAMASTLGVACTTPGEAVGGVPACVAPRSVTTMPLESPRRADVLFVVDNSCPMAEEQASLTAQFPRMLAALVDDVHVGVLTTDMGNGGFPVPTCATPFGDDGILITRGNTGTPGCMTTYPPFHDVAAARDPMQAATDFACVARVGTGGCGFEQPLEALLKAVTPSSSAIRFHGGTTGHADRENAGFLRDDSVLAIIVVTDEEDGSVADPRLYDPSSTEFSGDLNLRAYDYPHALHPVSRYVDGLRAVRPRERLVFGAITGVPPDLVADAERVSLDAILDDPRMLETLDTGATMTRLVPSCNVPGRGLAFAPRRIVEVARQLGPSSVVQSICQDNFGPALDAITKRISDAMQPSCLERPLARDETGRVACELTEVMPGLGDVTRCEQVPGRVRVRDSSEQLGEPEGREVCTVAQTAGASPGWYYDDRASAIVACGRSDAQRIAFTAPPARGATLRLECTETICDD